ncbi:MAG: hypothetical protein IPF99_20905 [Deltaproteobacteria bacterium]|nr:hypothetical protein [Deltaproteobacteria bacterium]
MNRAAQQLVARMEGKGLAKWLQLSVSFLTDVAADMVVPYLPLFLTVTLGRRRSGWGWSRASRRPPRRW